MRAFGESRIRTTAQVGELLRQHALAVVERDPAPEAAYRVPFQVWKIETVVPVASVPVRCIEVDNADHLYLAGRSMIPTHNSTLGLDIARSAAIKTQDGERRLLPGDEQDRDHHASAVGRGADPIAAHAQGHDERRRLAKPGRDDGQVSDAPMFIDDSPNMSMMEIRAKAVGSSSATTSSSSSSTTCS
jgi:replicative DNA helicase